MLRLRPLRPDDWEALFAVASDPLIWEQHPQPTRYQEEVFREYFREAMESGGAFAVIDKKNGEIIGSTRFVGYEEEQSEIEIGFTFLARSHWGGVYNREMKDLLLRHAFKFVRHVVFMVGRQNFRSQRAMEKIGAVRVQPRLDRFGRENVVFQIDAPIAAEFLVRRARIDDAAVVAWHRARMFQDMGEIRSEIFENFRSASQTWTEAALARGEYIGWLATPKTEPGVIIAGAGVQLRQVPPHSSPNGGFAKGRHAIVINVFTEPEWRKRGVARRLMDEIVRWARMEKLDRLVLHASAQGRSLYERMGFVETNEMRFGEALNE